MTELMFTLPTTTPNARGICDSQSGKTFKNVQEFIDILTQYELAKEEDIIIYTVTDFVITFNHSSVKNDSLGVGNTQMGNIIVENF